MTEFNGYWRAKPGSVMADGSVVDYRSIGHYAGPCFVPDNLKPARKAALGAVGWCVTPARDWPSILPAQGLACIHRTQGTLA